MNFYVTDTHALSWYLINSPALGVNARLAFDEADAGQALIYIPAIVVPVQRHQANYVEDDVSVLLAPRLIGDNRPLIPDLNF